ncbi:hypothetical protein MHSWG343_09990 [Candidatus Mycoplasma haematohominis]|uniref:Uncharacterized protein n=1 Tax=Candidatus Mycoplasma haematohominis TaxID=1494318 RepID=A0A478FR21_9MOLU|nr:hypothetical protein MHSWG343_09990 [Candidatus Mycoplasma haemohominis]
MNTKLKIASAATAVAGIATTAGTLSTLEKGYSNIRQEVKDKIDAWNKNRSNEAEQYDYGDYFSLYNKYGKKGFIEVIVGNRKEFNPSNSIANLLNNNKEDWKRIWGHDKNIKGNPVDKATPQLNMPFWNATDGVSDPTIHAVNKWISDMVDWCFSYENGNQEDPDGLDKADLEFQKPDDLYKEMCLGQSGKHLDEKARKIGEQAIQELREKDNKS